MINDKIFQQEHIFVVFFPGTAGNLISSLLDSLLNNNDQVTIASSGHAHKNPVNERKKQGLDFLSLGSGIVAGMSFNSEEEKINYYREEILKSDYNPDSCYVTWSHNYANIPLYNSLFPNGKILTINSSTLKERLIAIIMKVNKNSFSDDNELPVTTDEIRRINQAKEMILALSINKYYGMQFRAIPNELRDPVLMRYLMYRFYYDLFKFDNYESSESPVPNISARVKFNPASMEMVLAYPDPINHIGIKNYYELSFSDILNNSNNILPTVEKLVGRKLTDLDQKLVTSTLAQYITKQDSLIINEPRCYLEEHRIRADKIMFEWQQVQNDRI